MARRPTRREILWARWRSAIVNALSALWICVGLYILIVLIFGLR